MPKGKERGPTLAPLLRYETTIQETTACKKVLEEALTGMTYSFRRVINKKILPIQSQKKEESLDAKDVILHYPPDLSQFCRDDQPLFEKIGMQKEDVPFELPATRPLACENVPTHFPYAAYLEKELEHFNEEMQEGAKWLAKEKEAIELGTLWKNDPSLKKRAQKAIDSAQKKRDEAQKRVLEKVNASFNLSQAAPINITQLGIIGNDEACVTIRDLESIVLGGGREADLKRIERLYTLTLNGSFF